MNLSELTFESERLTLKSLALQDSHFIFKLLNTEGWLKFIGNRNINNIDDAENYIKKIIANENVNYWVATRKEDNIQTGVITLVKRDYLDNFDIGFAFLPAYSKLGYAFEASAIVLNTLLKTAEFKIILGITLPENISSIRLLERLGMTLIGETTNDNETLLLYQLSSQL